MLVPKHWAEATARHRSRTSQVTVLRYGWSDESESAARDHAQSRADDALARILAGEQLTRRERKVPYNGEDGLPIREEVLETHLDGDVVITRNSYGAQCLNVSDVLFADVDFERENEFKSCLMVLVGLGAGVLASRELGLDGVFEWLVALGLAVPAVWVLILVDGGIERLRGGRAKISARRVRRFVTRHPEWGVRLYGTPAGLRLLATHRRFDPVEDLDEIERFFRAVDADPMYRRMCRLQRCFRARLTPKPWRIGIADHLRPRPGTWPITEKLLPLRRQWVERYERESEGYAACRLLEELGSPRVDRRVAAVLELHDERARATTDLPLA